jgi:hypothetical protein
MTTTLVANAQTIYASYNSDAQASKAVGALLDYGVRAEDISIIAPRGTPDYYNNMSHMSTNADLGTGDGNVNRVDVRNMPEYRSNADDLEDAESASAHDKNKATSGITTTTGRDATVGAEKGAGIGLGIGAVAAVACLMVPGFGLVIGGGALATAIAGAAGATAAGAVAGGVHGYLKDQGVPDDAIGNYGQDYDAGDTLVAVTVPSNDVDVMTAHEILGKYAGKHINAY